MRDDLVDEVGSVADAEEGEHTRAEVREGSDNHYRAGEEQAQSGAIDQHQDEGEVEHLDLAQIELGRIACLLACKQVGPASVIGAGIHYNLPLIRDLAGIYLLPG